MKLIVGLGNPGTPYAQTRHNVGYHVLDAWCRQHGHPPVLSGATSSDYGGYKLHKAWPAMNVCGPQIHRRLQTDAIRTTDLLVIGDDLNLPLGRLRLRSAGSSGGHHGLESIMAAVGDAFPRLRIGIGAAPRGMDGADYVLGAWTPSERTAMREAVQTAVQAVDVWLQQGIAAAMVRFNRRVNQEVSE